MSFTKTGETLRYVAAFHNDSADVSPDSTRVVAVTITAYVTLVRLGDDAWGLERLERRWHDVRPDGSTSGLISSTTYNQPPGDPEADQLIAWALDEAPAL